MIESLAIIGEIHTGLLHHSRAISPGFADDLLRFVEGERVRRSQRPISYAVSPEVLTGIDYHLPMSSGRLVRGVGTVVTRASVTGGRVLQACAHMTVQRSATGQRLPWSHYLSQRGVVETLGRADGRHLAQGFLDGPSAGGRQLDLGAICAQTMNRVQNRPELDHARAFRAVRGRFRWAMTTSPSGVDTVLLSIGTDEVRRLRLPRVEAVCVAAHIDLCEDLALHDWLLTMVVTLVERGLDCRRTHDVLVGLRPAIDHLLHLWMPGARVDPALHHIREAVERRAGMSRQWRLYVDRIRDQLALRTLARLSAS